MLNRFSGTEDNKAALVSRVPLKNAQVLPEENRPNHFVFWLRRRPPSSRVRPIAVDGGKLAG